MLLNDLYSVSLGVIPSCMRDVLLFATTSPVLFARSGAPLSGLAGDTGSLGVTVESSLGRRRGEPPSNNQVSRIRSHSSFVLFD